MRTVLISVTPWPEGGKPEREYNLKKPRPNPRIFKPKLVELDYFKDTHNELAEMKRKKELTG
jgi:hypothetical protein